MKRRKVLGALAALPLGVAALAWSRPGTAAGTKPAALAEIQNNWQTFLAKGADVAQSTAPIQRTEAEWKQSLPEPQFAVLRKEATERPYSSALNGEKRAGVFVCAGCTLPLFTSQMKFESGTGWPSFLPVFRVISRPNRTSSSYCRGRSITAYAAAGIRDMFSMTGRRPPASAGATTDWRSSSSRRPARPESEPASPAAIGIRQPRGGYDVRNSAVVTWSACRQRVRDRGTC